MGVYPVPYQKVIFGMIQKEPVKCPDSPFSAIFDRVLYKNSRVSGRIRHFHDDGRSQDMAGLGRRKKGLRMLGHVWADHQIVYNYLTGSLISHIVQRFHDGGRVEITVDKSLNGIQRDVFDQYLVYKTFEKNQGNDLAEIPIEIDHADSRNEPCIQAADFIAGALHYYYRTDDDTFSGIIDQKVALAFDYFKGPQK